MTLIEVLASLMLMGSILVALVIARGRLSSQHVLAIQKQDAVQAADRLLAAWWADTSGTSHAFTPGQRGPVAGHPGWFWELSEVEGGPNNLAAQKMRLTINSAPRNSAATHHNALGQQVLVAVEVLVPSASRETDPVTISSQDTQRDALSWRGSP